MSDQRQRDLEAAQRLYAALLMCKDPDEFREHLADALAAARKEVEGDAVRRLLCHPAFRSIRNEPGAARVIVATHGNRTTFIGDTMEQTATRALAWLAKEADHG